MSVVPFANLPDDARLWVFAASQPIAGERAALLLTAVDDWLAEWKAHGEPLTCGRDWRENRFLAIGVDQSSAGASGCSIDALFRVLQQLQGALGTSLVGGGRVFYRSRSGAVEAVTRGEFASLAASGALDPSTIVFDTSITTAREYRVRFERQARDGWHQDFFPKVNAGRERAERPQLP
jgi:hypothetical protein